MHAHGNRTKGSRTKPATNTKKGPQKIPTAHRHAKPQALNPLCGKLAAPTISFGIFENLGELLMASQLSDFSPGPPRGPSMLTTFVATRMPSQQKATTTVGCSKPDPLCQNKLLPCSKISQERRNMGKWNTCSKYPIHKSGGQGSMALCHYWSPLICPARRAPLNS